MIYYIIVFWIVCGIIVTGAMNAFFRGEFAYIRHNDKDGWFQLCTSIGFGLGGPFSLIVIVFMSGLFYYGWTLRWRAEGE